MDVPPEYLQLRQKVDAFAAEVTARRGEDLKCRAGCAACCHVELTVSAVEAAAIRAHLAGLPAGERQALISPTPRTGNPKMETRPRCAMLRDDDTCAIYAARPLVCRSQGLPLLYPAEQVPEAARRGLAADASGRALSICPLNFTDADRPPGRADVLDAERVDVLLGLINRKNFSSPPSGIRYALADLAREFVE